MTRQEAINKVYGMSGTKEQHEALDFLVPEIRELREFYDRQQENEMMLREIKRYIKEQGDKPTGLPNGTVAVSDMIDWLEKQKEHKPAEWRHYIWATNLRFDYTALIKYDNTDNYEIVQAGNRPKQERNGVYILIKDIKPQSH